MIHKHWLKQRWVYKFCIRYICYKIECATEGSLTNLQKYCDYQVSETLILFFIESSCDQYEDNFDLEKRKVGL